MCRYSGNVTRVCGGREGRGFGAGPGAGPAGPLATHAPAFARHRRSARPLAALVIPRSRTERDTRT